MKLIEMFSDANMTGYRTEKDDNTTVRLSDLRKSKINIITITSITNNARC